VRKIIIPILSAFIICSCATSNGNIADAYADGSLVARQRAEIEQLKRDIIDMESTQREVSDRIERITRGLEDGLGRCDTIEDIFAEIDRFVLDLIDANNKIRGIQRTDRPEDART
jgi:predicted RNase H-like nuclease (RuvC/YqgF family)